VLGEGLHLVAIISSSLGNCSSIFELTFSKASSFRETKQIVKEEKVQNQKSDDCLSYIRITKSS